MLNPAETYDQPVWMLNGLAGNGWTIGPAVVQDMVADIFTSTFGLGLAPVQDVTGFEFASLDQPVKPQD